MGGGRRLKLTTHSLPLSLQRKGSWQSPLIIQPKIDYNNLLPRCGRGGPRWPARRTGRCDAARRALRLAGSSLVACWLWLSPGWPRRAPRCPSSWWSRPRRPGGGRGSPGRTGRARHTRRPTIALCHRVSPAGSASRGRRVRPARAEGPPRRDKVLYNIAHTPETGGRGDPPAGTGEEAGREGQGGEGGRE